MAEDYNGPRQWLAAQKDVTEGVKNKIRGAGQSVMDWLGRYPSKKMFGGMLGGTEPSPQPPAAPTPKVTGTPIKETGLLGVPKYQIPTTGPVTYPGEANPSGDTPAPTPSAPKTTPTGLTSAPAPAANLGSAPTEPYTAPETPRTNAVGLLNIPTRPTGEAVFQGNKNFEDTVRKSQEQSMPNTVTPPEETPGTPSKIGRGINHLISSLPEGDQKAHLTALAFGLGLMVLGA